MISFYGGPAGQSFEIKKCFSTFYDLNVDIRDGWKSNIAIGEFVMVSYGDPSDVSGIYEANRLIDLNDTNHNYNSTLWQKVYTEDEQKTYIENAETGGYAVATSETGINYRFISSCAGFTPRIKAEIVEWINPGLPAEVDVDTSAESGYPDTAKIEFKMPGSWNFEDGDIKVDPVDVNESPTINLENVGTEGNWDDDTYPDDNENPPPAFMGRFTFKLPQAQNLQGVSSEEKDADATPIAYLVKSGTYNVTKRDENGDLITESKKASVNEPIIVIELPQAQIIQEAIEVEEVLPSVKELSASLTGDVNNPTLKLQIPQAWQFELADTKWVDPGVDPAVTIDQSEDGTTKVLTFILPRTGKFYQAATLPAVDDTYHDGDIVIVTSNNTIYELVGGDWVAKGTLLPSFNGTSKVNALDPYDATTKEAVNPTVKLEQAADGTWSFTFGLPTAPLAEVTETKTLGPAEEATAAVEVSGADKLGFKFGIPRGSKMYSGATEPGDTITGDYWLNTDTGDLYEYKESGKVVVANLVGPTGAALNFIADLGEQASIEAAIAVLDANYSDATSEQLYSANIADDSGNIAYWFYKTAAQVGVAGAWTYSQLTGAVDSFIARAYVESDDKAYSATYVNSLIEGLDTETGEKKTYSQAKIDELLKALDETLNTWGRFADLPDLTTTT